MSVKNQVRRSLSSIQTSIRLAAHSLNLLIGFRGDRNRNRRSGRRASRRRRRSPSIRPATPALSSSIVPSNKQSLTLSICPNGTLALLLFSQSLVIHRHEEVIQRLSQRGMCKDTVANNGIRQLPHHGDLQYRHHFPAFHAKDRAT